MDSAEFLAKWKYLADARSAIDSEARALGERWTRSASPVQPGDTFEARGRCYIVTRVEVESPVLFAIYGRSVKARGKGRVEVFVGYTQPTRAAANARPDSSKVSNVPKN